MTSSVESLSTVTLPRDGVKIESILHKSSHKRHNGEDDKLTGCELIKKKCFGEDVKPSAGMCMIAFAIPLLIPGITLTAVAFDDETGFAKFSALHVLGIVMLILAVLLIIVGVLLNIRFKSRVGPDQALHTVSTHERLQNDKIFVTNMEDDNQKYPEIAAPPSTRSQGVNFMADSGHNAAMDSDHHVHFKTATVGASSFTDSHNRPTKKIFSFSTSDTERYSSSFESSDSEDFSSGSYIVSEEIEGMRESQEDILQKCEDPEAKELHSAPDITARGLQGIRKHGGKNTPALIGQTAHSISDTNLPIAEIKKSVNFFHDSEELNAAGTSQPSTSNYGDVRHSHQKSIQNGAGLRRKSKDKLSPQTAIVTCETPHQTPSVSSSRTKVGYSPATRQRLQALSSEMQAVISDVQTSQLSSNNSSCEKMSSGSNSSVFSLDKNLSAVTRDNEPRNAQDDDFHSDSEVETGHRSANGPVFRFLPKHVIIASSTGRVTQDDSHTEAQTARPKSHRRRKADKHKHRLSLDLNKVKKHTSHVQVDGTYNDSPLCGPKQLSVDCVDYDSEPKPLPKKKPH